MILSPGLQANFFFLPSRLDMMLVGFPGTHEKLLLEAFAAMKQTYPESPWSSATPGNFYAALYSTLSEDIHGHPWGGLKVRIFRSCAYFARLPSSPCLNLFCAGPNHEGAP